jgi:uracil-DNA glycosylase
MHNIVMTADYVSLVADRKACRLCEELTNPSTISRPRDCDRIGTYSLWQGNLASRLVVVGQDSADRESYSNVGKDYIDGHYSWPGAAKTNDNLVKLVAEAGITINPPRDGVSEDIIFLTNAVLCLKEGDMSAFIPPQYFAACGKKFLRPLLDIIKPKAVATLGSGALFAVDAAYGIGIDWTRTLTDLVQSNQTFDLSQSSKLFPMFHPSPRVLARFRSFDKQAEDWRRLGNYLQST